MIMTLVMVASALATFCNRPNGVTVVGATWTVLQDV